MKKATTKILSTILVIVLVTGMSAGVATATPRNTSLLFEVLPCFPMEEVPGTSVITISIGNERSTHYINGWGYVEVFLQNTPMIEVQISLTPPPGWVVSVNYEGDFDANVSIPLQTRAIDWHLRQAPAGTTPPAVTPTIQTPAPGNPSAWAREEVNRAIAAGLVPQNIQNNYTNRITRGEFTALVVALYETITGAEINGRVYFQDTNDTNIQKAAFIGVVTGTSPGNFSPNASLTREQAAVILSRLMYALNEPLPLVATTFADTAQMAAWAKPSIGQVQAAGIMGGLGNNEFGPRRTFTREQSIVTIYRLFLRLTS